jgi:hypothetical protein
MYVWYSRAHGPRTLRFDEGRSRTAIGWWGVAMAGDLERGRPGEEERLSAVQPHSRLCRLKPQFECFGGRPQRTDTSVTERETLHNPTRSSGSGPQRNLGKGCDYEEAWLDGDQHHPINPPRGINLHTVLCRSIALNDRLASHLSRLTPERTNPNH